MIGLSKFNLSYEQIGHFTISTINKLYNRYTDNFDFELMLEKTGTTHKKAFAQAQESSNGYF